MLMRKKGVENYEGDVAGLMNYFKAMDSKFYDELEGRADDMGELVKFLDGVGV